MTLRPSLASNRRLRVATLAALTYLGIGAAQAAWEVTDADTHSKLGEIADRIGRDGTVNGNLVKLYNQQKIGAASTAGSAEPEPTGDEALDHTAPSTVTVGEDERCPATDASDVASKQNQLCAEIVKTEKAKYAFTLRMYKLTETRRDRLKALEDERSGIAETDQGKLQDNSNKLLALLSLMQIDAQQQKTYMDAYDARLAYLGAARDALSRQALDGAQSGGGGGLPGGGGGGGLPGVGGVVGTGVLAAALAAVHTDRRYDPGSRP